VELQPFARVMRFCVSKMGSLNELFKTMESLPYYYQYIFSLSLYVVNNKHLFYKELTKIHNRDTRYANNFHLPITNLTTYQKGAHFAGIKIFNLPNYLKCVGSDIQVFKTPVKRFLSNSFRSIEEYFNSNK
jgi:hypothetical protein